MNSKIILCKNIKLDKEYRNVLNYTEQQMLDLCNKNKITEAFNYSFIRDSLNSISVNFTYEQCLQANYIAFQNPRYSNKWFFAFIDNIIYNTDSSTQINFIVDSWSTWFNKVEISECFVLREHVVDDIIGKHTVPEGLEMGDYIINSSIKYEPLTDFLYIIQVSEISPDKNLQPSPLPDNPVTIMGEIPMIGFCYLCDNAESLATVVKTYQSGKENAIIGTYTITRGLIGDLGEPLYESDDIRIWIFNKYTVAPLEYNVSKPTTLDGYTPKNKKLFTSPYNILILDNNNGVSNVLNYEYFSGEQASFEIIGVPTQGCSIKCSPKNYKNVSGAVESEGIIAGKLPTLGWVSDPYTNWLSQNAVNIGNGIISTSINFLGNLLEGNLGGMLQDTKSIMDIDAQRYYYDLMPLTSKGNVNGGDINTINKTNTFYFLNKCIKRENAIIIDDYFTRFGYKCNRLKVPNITGRPIFNYIQISSTDDIGFGEVPNLFMEEINQISRRGVTIWHNHNNIGNYNLNNNLQ